MYGVGFDAGEGTGDDGNPRSSEGAGVGGLSFESSVALPPPDLVATWLAALIARDGATAVIKALLPYVAGDRIMDITEQICEQQFGREPVLADSLGEVRTRRLAVPRGASWRLVCSSAAHCALSHLLCVCSGCGRRPRERVRRVLKVSTSWIANGRAPIATAHRCSSFVAAGIASRI